MPENTSYFEPANPGIVTGSCSQFTKLSISIKSVSFTTGVAAPIIVISAYPTAIGSCSQALDLGYRRTGAFTITVGV